MIQNYVGIEVEKGERTYQLLCPVDSPLGEIHDVLSQMKGFVVQKIQEVDKAQQSQGKPEETQSG